MERRDFVRYCSALIAMGLSPVAVRANEGIRVIRGDPDVDHTSASNVRVRSKKRHIVVAVKKNIFLVSPDSEVHFEHDESFLLSATRLIAGGIHSVFDPEETQPRAVSTPHVTAAIRGPGTTRRSRTNSTGATVAVATVIFTSDRVTDISKNPSRPRITTRE